jgi:hypothetical protein
MLIEPVQRALRRLDGLIAREGTSPLVADGLCRAAQQLRTLGAGGSGDDGGEARDRNGGERGGART